MVERDLVLRTHVISFVFRAGGRAFHHAVYFLGNCNSCSLLVAGALVLRADLIKLYIFQAGGKLFKYVVYFSRDDVGVPVCHA